MSESQLIPAATVLILRDAPDDGLEVFMVKRHHQIDFASGALVFPGGKVDKSDFDPQLRAHCTSADGLDDRALALRIGAIREAFEECGVLLARKKGQAELINGADLQSLNDWRDKFNDRAQEVTMLDFALAENLDFAIDKLTHFAHWVTPDMMPKRFDTHFYIARMPADHLAEHDGSEGIDSIWITPQKALAEAAAKRLTIIFPTRMNVEKLAQSVNVEAAIENCGEIVTVTPFVEKEGDRAYLRIQPDAGYGDPKEDITNGM